MGRNIAGCGSSVRLAYFPSSTIPTTWMRVPSRLLKYPPMAFAADPKTVRANCWLTTATLGAFLASCYVNVLPQSKAVPAARKYSGVKLDRKALGAALDGVRSLGAWENMSWAD